jgi:hypothetical protein
MEVQEGPLVVFQPAMVCQILEAMAATGTQPEISPVVAVARQVPQVETVLLAVQVV